MSGAQHDAPQLLEVLQGTDIIEWLQLLSPSLSGSIAGEHPHFGQLQDLLNQASCSLQAHQWYKLSGSTAFNFVIKGKISGTVLMTSTECQASKRAATPH